MTDRTSPMFEEITAKAAELRAEQARAIDPAALKWLAVMPEWTDELANLCGFPSGSGGLDAVLDAAARLQLCDRTADFDGTREVVRFWMPSLARETLLQDWADAVQGGELRAVVEMISSRVLELGAEGLALQPGVARWAELADCEVNGGGRTGEVLIDKVDQALENGDTGEALGWLSAGESLGPVLGAEMVSAVARAKRRLNLQYRLLHDNRYLERFFERADQLAALEELVAQPGVWAVHFVGVGGVGKTMLLRYLTGPYASSRGMAASRIDFDHVDPRYPSEQPGRLLQELAEGLTLFAREATQESLLRSLFGALTAADRAAAVATAANPGDPLAGVRTREVSNAVDSFAAFADALKRPVVLVLDTCEELAKLHPTGDDVPSVVATFEMLDQLANRAANVRVVLAGRRMLTPAAANWRDEPSPEPTPVMSLAPQPGLMVHEIRGFTEGEVRTYLSTVRELDVRPRIMKAILGAARETGRVRGIGDAQSEVRYSPFDVAVYADWLESDEQLTEQQIAVGDLDAYITVRIIDRLRNQPDAIRALPAAVLLGRFDRVTIAPVLPSDPRAAERTILALREREWIETSPSGREGDSVLEVDRALLPRLRRYYTAEPERKRQYHAAERALAPILLGALQADSLSQVSFEQVDAALRILPPGVAASAFDRLAMTVAAEEAWWWAEATCARLLAVDRDEPIPAGLLGSVRALWIAGLLHRGASLQLDRAWDAVAAEAADHPDADAARLLRARAELGAIAGRGHQSGLAEADRIAEIARRAVDEDVAALTPAFIAAIEAVLDSSEHTRAQLSSAHAGRAAHAIGYVCQRCTARLAGDPALQRWLALLRAKAGAILGPHLELATQSMTELCRDWPTASERWGHVYADWSGPASPRHRAMLEALRFAVVSRGAREQLLQLAAAAATDEVQTIDHERLLSLALQVRLAGGEQVPAEWLTVLEPIALAADFVVTATAHGSAPPLFASVADAWLRLGEPERALALVGERERRTSVTRDQQAAEGEAALATLRVVRRMRLAERAGQVRQLSAADDPTIRFEALAARAVVSEEDPRGWLREPDPIWTTLNLLEPEQTDLPSLLVEPDRGNDPITAAHYALDRLEAELVTKRRGGVNDSVGASELATNAVDTLLTRPPRDPGDPFGTQVLRITLRAFALGVAEAPAIDQSGEDGMLGRLAFEEGELLALRVPDASVRLLDFAADRLATATDAPGAALATVRSGIAAVHAGESAIARARLRQAQARYLTAQAVVPALPRWDELMTTAHQALSRDDLTAPWGPWSQWLRRLVALNFWCDDSSSSLNEGAALPAELQLRSVAAPRLQIASRAWRMVGFLRPLIRVLRKAGASLSWERAEGGEGYLIDMRRQLRALWLRRYLRAVRRLVTLESIEIVPVTSADGSGDPLAPAATISVIAGGRSDPVSRSLRLVQRILGSIVAVDVAIWTEPFEEKLPPELIEIVRPSGKVAARRLKVTVAPSLAAGPWEARLLAASAADPTWTPRSSPQVSRTLLHRARARTQWPGSVVSTAIAASEWSWFVERSWLDAVAGECSFLPVAPEQLPAGSRAVLLVGTPVATGLGWRLRVGQDDVFDAETRNEPYRTLVNPEIAIASPIVMVVGTPGGERPTEDRQCSNGLRGFADEAFGAGAHAVVTVPTLPPVLAEQLVQTTAERLNGWRLPPPRESLLKLVTDLRDEVFAFAGAPGDEAARRERVKVALDVCLYAPGD